MTASIAVADLLYKRSNKRSKRSHRWSPPRSPASCTTPKWAFCARVLAGSQKIWKTPSVHFILWKTLGKENCGFITWLCVIPKMAKSTFNFLQVKTQRLIAITDFCWEFTLVFQNFSDSSQNSDLTGQYSIPVKNSPETTQISGAIWPGASAKPPVGCIRASKGGDFRPTPKMSGRLELNHPNIHREKSVDWKNVWKMLKDVVQPFLNKSVQAHPNHQVSPACLFFETLPLAGCTRKQPWDILQKTRSLTLGRDLRLWRFEALFLPYQRDFGASFNWHLAVKTHNEPSQTKYFLLLDWSKYLGSAFMLWYSWPWTYQDSVVFRRQFRSTKSACPWSFWRWSVCVITQVSETALGNSYVKNVSILGGGKFWKSIQQKKAMKYTKCTYKKIALHNYLVEKGKLPPQEPELTLNSEPVFQGPNIDSNSS